MPCYDYRCAECATIFEQRRSIANADDPAVCPVCASLLTERLLSTITMLGTSAPSADQPPRPKAHRVECRCCTPRHARGHRSR